MIVVTGGTGFTGGYVVRALLEKGFPVRIFARDRGKAAPLIALGAEASYGSFEEPRSLIDAFRGSDLLLNIASLGFGHAPAIIEAAREAGIRRAVFVSTTAIFTGLNAQSKAIRLDAERWVQDSGLDWTILRPTMIFGNENDRNIFRLLRFLQSSPVMPVFGDGRRLQQPVHVKDVARAIIDSAHCPASIGKAYNIAGKHPLSFNELIDTAASALGRKVLKVHLPLRAVTAPLGLYERLARRPFLKAEQVLRLAEDKAFSYEEAARDFQYAPRSFQEGVSEMVRDLRSRGKL